MLQKICGHAFLKEVPPWLIRTPTKFHLDFFWLAASNHKKPLRKVGQTRPKEGSKETWCGRDGLAEESII